MAEKHDWRKLSPRVWDLDSGFCPNGHPLEECILKFIHPATNKPFYKCSKGNRIKERGGIARPLPSEPLRMLKNFPSEFGIGSGVLKGSKKGIALVTFVCSHVNHYDVEFLYASKDEDPGDLYCVRCDAWRGVHSVLPPGSEESWIYHQLEVMV